MLDLKKLQKEIYDHKVSMGFNVTDVNLEFNLMRGEVAEAFDAYLKKSPETGEELADVAIYLLGLAEILQVDLESEILNKMKKNKTRVYTKSGDKHIKEE
jgi:NTP pyrophosphatase (non-canonical NTP hydrolase)